MCGQCSTEGYEAVFQDNFVNDNIIGYGWRDL